MVKRSRSIDQLHSIDGDEFVPDDTHPEMAEQQSSVHRDVTVELIDQARPQFQACSSSRESNGESKKFKSNETQQTQVIVSPVVSAALEASITQRVEPDLITINVQTLSGMLPPISMSAQATVRDLKLRLQTLNSEFGVDRQKLSIAASNDADACIVLQNHRTLQFYQITGRTNVVLVVSPSLEVAVRITDRDLKDAHHFKALLENQNLRNASMEVRSIDSHQAQLFQLFVENRSIQSIEIIGQWAEEHLSFCEALLTMRPDADIRLVVTQDTDMTMMLRVVNFCQLNKCLSINLSTKYIDAPGSTALAIAMHSMSSLKSMSLQINNQILAPGCRALAQALQSMSSLRSLSLSIKTIGAPGCRALATALQSMPSLQSLNLSSTQINAPAYRTLAAALQPMRILKSLNLSKTVIGAAGCQALAPALHSMRSLKSLDLSCNKIEDEGCEALASVLDSMPSLQSLNLSENRIGASACRALAPALEWMPSLQTLNLRYNKIGVSGCAALAPALQAMSSLQTLDLSCNWMKDSGCRALAPALLSMPWLQSLNLSNNQIGAAGCAALVPALQSILSLQSLDLSCNWIGAEGCVVLKTALQQMPLLHSLNLDGTFG